MQLELPMPRTIFSVTQITKTLSRIIEQQPVLQNVWVKGQVSNLSRPASGHIYFTLKDENSNIRSVAFRSSASRLQFLPRDGDEVLVQGRINIYAASSEYQIIINTVEPLGVGALQRAFEELKQKLSDEGLFDDRHKKALPVFPKKIGVITSETGAAIQDIQQQLQKRYPLAGLLLYPTLVQGEYAAAQIARAIRDMNNRTDIDVLIVGRGGGSLEDLWAFNEEIVARAIFDSEIPIVSAIGHETDFTISDMVSDHRSPTPSAAVEHVVPDRLDLLAQLNGVINRLNELTVRQITTQHAEVDALELGLSPSKRKDTIYQLSQSIDGLEVAYQKAINDRLSAESKQLQSLAARLNGLSPLATLKRGYSICRTSSGDVVRSNAQINVGERLDVKLSQGNLVCTVDECIE
ncbi:MAG: exodeoxyribonuclease VII large subunit [Candidatus Poribacteria bacterium]|nr:exodeoxyribonuclease VII large subunit [Candidatus Poribacteria bacterium]